MAAAASVRRHAAAAESAATGGMLRPRAGGGQLRGCGQVERGRELVACLCVCGLLHWNAALS